MGIINQKNKLKRMAGKTVAKVAKKASPKKQKTPKKVAKRGGKRRGRVAGQKNKKRFFKIDSKWKTGLYKVLKQVHPDLQTTKKAMIIMNSVVNAVSDKL